MDRLITIQELKPNHGFSLPLKGLYTEEAFSRFVYKFTQNPMNPDEFPSCKKHLICISEPLIIDYRVLKYFDI